MADEIVSKVIMEADASQLQSAFDTLVNSITQTKEQLKEYKNDKEKSAELTAKLAEQEKALAQVIKQNNGVIESSNVSYKQLDDILKDLRKQYKQTADEMGRSDLAPAIKGINNELKGMDASLGDFKRNVGNYEGAIENASRNISESFRSIVQTLPSLTESPERFFMALAQNLPKLVSAYKNITTAQKDAAAATEMQVTLDKAEMAQKSALAGTQTALNTAKVASAAASGTETKATSQLIDAEIKETSVTVESAKADLDRIKTARASIEANIQEAESVFDLMKAESLRMGNLEKIQAQYGQIMSLRMQLKALDEQEVAAVNALAAAEGRLNVLLAEKKTLTNETTVATTAAAASETAAGAAAETMAAGEEAATVATNGLKAALSSFLLIATVVISIIAIFGKDLVEWVKNLDLFNNEAKKAIKFQKEWNEEMKTGHQNAAKQVVDLQIYSKWATMASKSDKERTYAAKEVLKTLGSAVTTTNIAKVKNGEFQTSIDEVTKALIRQAQAQALTNKITEKYKDVVEAQDNLARKKAGEVDAIGSATRMGMTLYSPTAGVGSMPTPSQTQQAMNQAITGSIERAQKKLDKVKEDFDKWLENFLKEFNPTDLLFSGGNGPDGNGKDWFSKWELYIKQYEASLAKLQGEYEELDLASIWKYSAEGLEYYTKMYDEYIEHYSADAKALKEAQINKQKYLTEFNEYHTKLQKQWMDATKTEYQIDMDKLEEWYTVQLRIYENAGEDTTALTAEYTKRKQDILDKYIDKYKNAEMERQIIDASINNNILEYNKKMMDLELQNLDDTMNKEIKEYERKGMDTTNLEEHYAIERMKIISKYAEEETQAIIASIQKQEQALQRRNEQMLQYQNMGGAGYETELNYAKLGGTTMTGHQQRQNEIGAKQNEANIWADSMNQQIQAMQEVLASGKLVGDEMLAMQQQLADTERELALGTAEYKMELNEMVLEDARQTTDEYLGYAQSAFSGLEGIFNNVYTAIEKTIEAEVKEGKISSEEAEKQLKEYRGIQAAAAMMNALGSAVGAYNSMASIPYVGPALGAIAAAAALAAGIANVKQIMATTKSNVGNADNSYAQASPSLSDYTPQYVTNVTGKDDTDYLANAISEKPLRAFVVESDVSAAQELENNRTQETTW